MAFLPGVRSGVSGLSTYLTPDWSDSCTRPYYGQGFWFLYYHPEKLLSAQSRYQAEVRRVLGVLETVLSKREWLVGGRMTIADLIYVPCVVFPLPSSRLVLIKKLIGLDGTTSLTHCSVPNSILRRSFLQLSGTSLGF